MTDIWNVIIQLNMRKALTEHIELTFHLQLQWPYRKSPAHVTPSAYVGGGPSASADLS